MGSGAIAPSLAAAPPHTCPPPPPPGTPPPPPAPIPPGPARDFRGLQFARTTGVWWRPGDVVPLRIGARLGDAAGYGTWGDAVAAATAGSAGRAGAVAICDDRGRLYVYRIEVGCGWFARPFQLGARHETGYRFHGDAVRGIVDGDRIASRGDCLHPWVPTPPLATSSARSPR